MIRVHLLAIVAAALLLIAPTAARAQRYTLFSGGATGYDIVVGNNAPSPSFRALPAAAIT